MQDKKRNADCPKCGRGDAYAENSHREVWHCFECGEGGKLVGGYSPHLGIRMREEIEDGSLEIF